MKDEFITVPVLESFLNDKVIGELKIRADALPMIPGFVFSIGFKCLEKPESAPGEVPRTAYKGPYELMCVSLVADENYIGYLRQVGKLPHDSAEIPQNASNEGPALATVPLD